MAKAMWTLFLAAHPVCAWFGYVEGVEGARNLLAFFVVALHFTLALMSVVVSDEAARRAPKSVVQRVFWRLCTYSTLGLLVWFGAWGTGGFLAVAALLAEAGRHAADAKRAELAKGVAA